MLNQERLKELLDYNSETGIFTRKKSLANCVPTGVQAGTINSGGYIRIMVDGIIYPAHRLAWLYIYGEWPKNEIDHINHIRDDNRIINLRDVSRQENLKNIKKRKNNKSGVTGVICVNKSNSWISQIKVNSKRIHLGSYRDKFEAICARKSAENKYGFHENHGAI